MNGAVGLAFWLAFAGLFVWCAVATRRHDRKAELDADDGRVVDAVECHRIRAALQSGTP